MKIYRFILILFSASFLSFAIGQEIKTSCPAMRLDYSPPGNAILAHSSFGAVSETDVLLYLAIARDKDPNVFFSFQNEQDPAKKRRMRDRLQDIVKSYVFIQGVSRENSVESPENERQLRLRLLSYPLYELVWVEEISKKNLRILEEDIIAYYRRNSHIYEKPASVKVRIMYLHAPRVLPELERQKIQRRIETLRERALEGESFEYLVNTHSSFYPGTTQDGIMEVYHAEVYNRFYEEARAIRINAFSPIFQREDGFFFLECLEKRDPEVIPLSRVRKDIARILKSKALRFLYAFEWKKLKERYHPAFNWYGWEDMKDSHVLIAARKLKITKADFWRLFPEIISDNLSLNEPLIREKAGMIHQYECIRLEVERKKLKNHPFIIQGTRIARDQMNADARLEQLSAPLKIVSEEEIKRHYEDNAQLFTVNSSKRVRQIIGETLNPIQYDAKALQDVFLKMEANLHLLIKEAEALIKREKETISTNDAPEYPDMPSRIFEDLLKQYSTDLYRFEFRDMAPIKPEDSGDIWGTFENLFPGDFSPIEKSSPFVYCRYIESFDPGQRRPLEAVADQIRKRLIQSRIAKASQELKSLIIQKSGLQFDKVIQ